MSTETLDIPQPLRLAKGSHARGTGYACAMNVIAWETQEFITDMPQCVAAPLARLMHLVNDNVCGELKTVDQPDLAPSLMEQIQKAWGSGDWATMHPKPVKLLCSKCSMSVLDLAHRMVGTAADVTDETLRAWMREVLNEARTMCNVHLADLIRAATATRRLSGDEAQHILALARRSVFSLCEKQVLEMLIDYLCSFRFTGVHVDDFVYRYNNALALHIAAGQRNREFLLVAGHRAVDAWEKVAGRRTPQPDPQRVVEAYRKASVAAA